MKANVCVLLCAVLGWTNDVWAGTREFYDVCVRTATAKNNRATVDEALSACSGPANEGVPGAMYVMGSLLKKGGPLREREAMRWFDRAAKAGHPGAAYELARGYMQASDDALRNEGVRWLQFAACSGYSQAEQFAKESGVSIVGTRCPKIKLSNFDGVWSGSLEAVREPRSKLELRVSISGTSGHVFINRDGAWSEVKAGSSR